MYCVYSHSTISFIFLVNYQKAFQAAKAARGNLSLVDILLSDREKSFGRGKRTVKKRTWDDKLKSNADERKKTKRLTEERVVLVPSSSVVIEEAVNTVCTTSNEPDTMDTIDNTSMISCGRPITTIVTSSLTKDHFARSLELTEVTSVHHDVTTTNLLDTSRNLQSGKPTINFFRPFFIEENGTSTM